MGQEKGDEGGGLRDLRDFSTGAKQRVSRKAAVQNYAARQAYRWILRAVTGPQVIEVDAAAIVAGDHVEVHPRHLRRDGIGGRCCWRVATKVSH